MIRNFELQPDTETPLEVPPHITDEAKNAKTLKAPCEPTETERQLHNLTHLPYRNWCKHCVSGKSPDSAHKATDHHTTLNLIQFDYKYFTEQVKGKKLQRTALTMVGCKTGIPLCITVPRKGNCEHTVAEVCSFLTETGRADATLQSDNEPSLLALLDTVVKRLPSLRRRLAPTHSPQTLGNVEKMNDTVNRQTLTLFSELKTRYGLTADDLTIERPLFDWCVKHSSFTVARYLLHSDGLTSYERRWSKPYTAPLCQFGETVMLRASKKTGNQSSHWCKGLWLGRCTASNAIITALPDGTVRKVRTVKRLPTSEQTDKELLVTFCCAICPTWR